MPFDYDDYKKKCDTLTTEQLHKEWENYTRQIAGGATSTATSVLLSPLTAGISLMGLGLSAPRIHNARKKRDIIQAGLEARGDTHNTRKRDVIAPMAVAGTISGLTFGLAGPIADAAAGQVVGHGIEYAASHAVLDGIGATAEHKHDEHSKKKADKKTQAQYQRFEQHYNQQLGIQQGQQPPMIGYQPMQQNGMPAATPVYSQGAPPPPYQGLPGQVQVQEQKYDYVPVPEPHRHSISYQPASHQQGLNQPLPQHPPLQHASTYPLNFVPTMQSMQPPGTSQALSQMQTPTLGSPVENVQYRSTEVYGSIQTIAQENTYSVPTTQYPQPQPTTDPNTVAPLFASLQISNDEKVTIQTEETVTLTPDQEISLLKARILQMEIEKREGVSAPPPVLSPQPETPAPSKSTDGFPDMEYYPPPTPIPVPQSLPPPQSMPTPQPQIQAPVPQKVSTPPVAQPQMQPQNTGHPQYQTPPNQVVQQVPTPPPSQPQNTGYPQYQTSQPPAAQAYSTPPPPQSPSVYSPQQYAPPAQTSVPQQQYMPQQYAPAPTPIPQQEYAPVNAPHPPNQYQQQQQQQAPQVANPGGYPNQPGPSKTPQPEYNRTDSGYYSGPPTRTASTVSNMSTNSGLYTPATTLSPQSTGNAPYGYRHSVSYSVPSFNTPSPMSPPQYQQPYFPPPPPAGRPPSVANGKDYFSQNAPPQYQGTQGWQWGAPAPVQQKMAEPNYGPPPSIPQPWKG